MDFTKVALTVEQQIDLLEGRGMIFANKERASRYLENINYYRLSAYSYPFRKINDPSQSFVDFTNFETILNIYLFDRKLKLLLFDIIERFEVALRTQIIYRFSLTYGPYFFQNKEFFSNLFFLKNDLLQLDKEIARSSETFIKHYQKNYSHPQRPPSWMSLEVSSLGLLSKIYRDLKLCEEKKQVSKHFGLMHPYVLESWIHNIAGVRNIIAHHGRLWNRKLTIAAKVPKRVKYRWLENKQYNIHSLYASIVILLYLVRSINPNTQFVSKLFKLFDEYSNDIDLQLMGFPKDWEKEKFWK